MNKTRTAFLIAAMLAGGSAMAQGAAGLVSERSISTNAALELATTSLERCRADGYKVTITVLNRHARTAVVVSDDGVNPHTIENSLRKAYTAFTTRGPSADMSKRTQPGLAGFMQLDKITTIEGGLPIFAGKELVGAVGISGAPGGEKDAACAQAGLDRIARSLGG
ncbi:GlcG/HbpS family heme-binding protein [Polaromonas sp.]|uniref:GlcG/HbpS family heme-binding protein n=1 Tax=Polaromonas sp. TaxID=1869339 RepID=UPI003360EFC4